ncbi:4-hydroxybenzoyl-CoA reductase, partial [Frankia sp. AiPs1]|nr:4-hydroxybenzoyl-CoA reductase [Frankia sp. AiPs1]
MLDARVKVTGRLQLVGDLAGADVGPGLLHARLLTSTEPHALIRVDTAQARQTPGVAAVFSGAELEAALGRPARFGPILRDQPPLAVDRVRYAGE